LLNFIGFFKYFGYFFQYPGSFFGVIALDCGQQARIEVPIQQVDADFIQGSLHGLDLADNVYAVLVVFQHALDSTDMPLNNLETLDIIAVVVLHHSSSTPPPMGGISKLYKYYHHYQVMSNQSQQNNSTIIFP